MWHAELELPARRVALLGSLLDPEERARALRFAFDAHRRRYVVAHGLLRQLLGQYLGTPAEAVRLARARHGKPYVDEPGAPHFNLSHSGGRALIAIAAGRELGVDLERVRADRDVEGIARRFFSPAEQTALRAVADDDRVRAFYRCWTRKEAYMKATGAGMAMALNSFDVAFEPCVPAALLRSERGADEPERWTLVGLAAGAGFEAALAVEGDGWRLVERAIPVTDEAARGLG